MICCSRFASVSIERGSSRIHPDHEIDVLDLGHVAEGALDVLLQVVAATRRSDRPSTVPDSIFDRSRMSLISISRSLPDE